MKLKYLKRFINVILTITLMFTLQVSAFAEVNEQTDFTLKSQSASNEVYGPGRWYFGEFSFYDFNRGYYHTFIGKRIRLCLAYKQPGENNYSADFAVWCYSYDDGFLWERSLCAGQREPDENGFRYIVFDWTPIRNGGDYRFEYQAYGCGTGEPRNATCHVWIDVE